MFLKEEEQERMQGQQCRKSTDSRKSQSLGGTSCAHMVMDLWEILAQWCQCHPAGFPHWAPLGQDGTFPWPTQAFHGEPEVLVKMRSFIWTLEVCDFYAWKKKRESRKMSKCLQVSCSNHCLSEEEQKRDLQFVLHANHNLFIKFKCTPYCV